MRIVITGGAGFLGSHLCHTLVRRGDSVVCVDDLSTGNLGNIALLAMAASHGLLDAGLAERARDAYREFRRRQHALRLNGAQYARVPLAELATHVDAVRRLWRLIPDASA